MPNGESCAPTFAAETVFALAVFAIASLASLAKTALFLLACPASFTINKPAPALVHAPADFTTISTTETARLALGATNVLALPPPVLPAPAEFRSFMVLHVLIAVRIYTSTTLESAPVVITPAQHAML